MPDTPPKAAEAPMTYRQALRRLPQSVDDLLAAWVEDMRLRRERDWATEYREAYEAGHEAARRDLGLSDDDA